MNDEQKRRTRQGPGAHQESNNYKVAPGYIGILQDAKRAVQSAQEKKAAAKTRLETAIAGEAEEAQEEEDQEPSSGGPSLAERLSFLQTPAMKRLRMWITRIIILAALIWQWNVLWRELHKESALPETAEDVLISIDESYPDFDGTKNYVQYIVSKVANGGAETVDGKWIEGIPPSSKAEAKPLLELLASGYKIGRVSADKAVIYNVECHPDINQARCISVEVVRSRLGGGKVVYRLQKVY